jgi:hypothetical protein
MNFEEILTLLIGTAEEKVKPSELIEACNKFNMRPVEYININDDLLFDSGHIFIFQTESGEEARLEIIEFEGNLLQSGFQIIYTPRLLFSKINKDFSLLYTSLQIYYINEQPQSFGEFELFNFFNENSQCYLSKSKINGRDVLNFRVANKDVWMKYRKIIKRI